MATNAQPSSQKEQKLLTAKFKELLAKVAENRPKDDPEIIRKAYEFSLKHHQGQTRASGEPYLVHPLEVAVVLADMKLDSTAIAAGLLHDAIEDTEVTHEDVRREFGDQVVHIVEGVTKIDKIDFASREERQAENVRKMVLAMVDDIRVVLVKLADRLHNMRTLEYLPEERRQNIAKETMDIYAPMAHRLGMGRSAANWKTCHSAILIPSVINRSMKQWKRGARRRGVPGQGDRVLQREAAREWRGCARGQPH